MSITAITALVEAGKFAINKFFPDPQQKANALQKLAELQQVGDLAELSAYVNLVQAQTDINKEEAKHKSIFVAGWRPFVGWVGGFTLMYVGLIEPMMRFVATMSGYGGDFPNINPEATYGILTGMLGVAGMRSFDKSKGVQTDVIK